MQPKIKPENVLSFNETYLYSGLDLLKLRPTPPKWNVLRHRLFFETQRNLNDRYAQAVTKFNLLNSDNTKAIQREQQTQLVAPVDGVIQQLAVHTVGAVVTSAQPSIVVPDSPTVTAEVAIANQDIGFVSVGQPVEVKLETFSYTKYGTVPAVVEVVIGGRSD